MWGVAPNPTFHSLIPGFCHRHSARHNRVSAVESHRKRDNISFSRLPPFLKKRNRKNFPREKENHMNPKWEKVCKISNIILSILYITHWWAFSYFGLCALFIGSGVWVWIGLIFALVVVPLFCIFGIIFSVRFRKKQKYVEAFLIQFIPFSVFFISMILFFIIIWF